MTAIGVFVATRWESAAVCQAFAASEMRVVGGIRCAVARQGQVEWWVIPMGVGPERATTTAGRVLGEQSFAAVWSTGFACALGQAVIGEVLIGTHVTMEGGAEDGRSVPCAAAGADWVRQAVQQQRLPVQAGQFVSVPRVLCRAEDKQEIATRAGGVGLDMESAAVKPSRAEWDRSPSWSGVVVAAWTDCSATVGPPESAPTSGATSDATGAVV